VAFKRIIAKTLTDR